MPEYDFRTLSAFDLELLVRDLLQAEYSKRFENFKPGRDGGIDLRHCISEDKEIIGQVKHYAASGFPALIRHLSSAESPRVAQIKPHHYILATSVSLSPAQMDQIKDIFLPYCSGRVDVLGKESLNNLLSKHPQVETGHYKLWLSSTAILQRVLHNDVLNNTKYTLDEIAHKLCLYVQHGGFTEACEKLNDQHVCIISGEPGIGKTTLAEMLMVKYIADDYEIRVIQSINDAMRVDFPDSDSPIVYFYDDFLGQSSLIEGIGNTADASIVKFITAIRRRPNTRFILTTREYILREALQKSERLSNENLSVWTMILDLGKYSRQSRAHILYNHLYFSELSINHQLELLKDGTIIKIIDHPHYNPRIIEWMTRAERGIGEDPKEYVNAFIEALNNPLQVWKYAFERVLTDQKTLLYVLYTLNERVNVTDLETCYEHYHQTLANERNDNISSCFRIALKSLDGSFISVKRDSYYGQEVIVDFYNPSIREFVGRRIQDSPQIIARLLDSAKFFEQCHVLWKLINTNESEDKIPRATVKKITNALISTLSNIKSPPERQSKIEVLRRALLIARKLPSEQEGLVLAKTYMWLLNTPTIGRTEAKECSKLIDHLTERLLTPIKQRLAKSCLKTAQTLDDLESSIRLYSEHNEVAQWDESESESIRSQVSIFLDDFDESDIEGFESRDYYSAIETIESLGEEYDINVQTLTDGIYGTAEAMKEKEEKTENTTHIPHTGPRIQKGISDEEVLSLFQTLPDNSKIEIDV